MTSDNAAMIKFYPKRITQESKSLDDVITCNYTNE